MAQGKIRVLGVLTAAACATAACSSSSGSKAAGTGNGGASGGQAATAASSTAHYKIGVVEFSSADPTSVGAVNGYKAEAQKLGYSVSVVDANGSADSAVAAMQDFVQQKVDMVITEVFPSSGLAAGAEAAKAAGIPVVSLAGGTADGIETNWDAGYAQGQAVAGHLVSDMGGKGALLELTYHSGLPCVDRQRALTDALKGTSIAVSADEVPIPGQVQGGTNFAQAWLAQHPGSGQALAVWGCFDDPAMGAIAAIEQAGRSGIKVYGINGTSTALKAVQDGQMTATVWLDVQAAGTDIADKTAQYIHAGVDSAPSSVPIPFSLVDKSNVASFLASHPGALSGA